MSASIQVKGTRNGTPPPSGMIVPSHGGGLLKPIQPGEARNPGGKGGLWQETQRIARQKSPEAARRLTELIDSTDERVALLAADKLLTWAWGKPPEHDPRADRPPMQIDTSVLAPEECKLLLAILRRGLIKEAEPTPTDTPPVQIDGTAE